MNLENLHALLEAFEEPAFFVREGRAVLGNAAFGKLNLEEGTELEAFFSAEEPLRGEFVPARVCGEACLVKTVELGEGKLYLLSRERPGISVNVLAHTAKSLRETLQQMYSALDRLDQSLPEETPETDGPFSSLLRGIFRVTRVADNLAYLQRLQSGSYVPCFERLDLRGELIRLLEEAQALLEQAGIRLIWEVPASTYIGSVDRKLLSLAMWNLLANAAEHAEGGFIRVTAERIRLTRLRIKVTDSGTGIAVNRQADLMQRYQVSPEEAAEQTGVGLGLSLAAGAARIHDGSLAVSMESGSATTVALVFETNRPASVELRSDITVFDRSLDEGLIGLSDVLPGSAYDRRDILS